MQQTGLHTHMRHGLLSRELVKVSKTNLGLRLRLLEYIYFHCRLWNELWAYRMDSTQRSFPNLHTKQRRLIVYRVKLV